MEKWCEDAKSRIKALKKSHNLQRIQLELAFETAPRDSRYSNTLIDMMKKEEQVLGKDPNPAVSRAVTQKVDETLRGETRAFFAKSVQKNVKRWTSMKDKFNRESQQFANEIMEEMRKVKPPSDNSRQISATNKSVPTPTELDEEADRLECDYNKNWYKYENFSLQEAFKSQQNRIENDWSVHEKALEEEYRVKRERIAGPMAAYGNRAHQPSGSSNHNNNGGHDPRWQHPEKQKTLIHTAPVLSPTRQPASQQQKHRSATSPYEYQDEAVGVGGSGGWNAKTSRELSAGAAAELDRIHREYEASLRSMQKQKGDAKRWLYRQQVRLQAQAIEVQWERSAIADFMQEDAGHFQTLLADIQ